jgi:hypothetical protein
LKLFLNALAAMSGFAVMQGRHPAHFGLTLPAGSRVAQNSALAVAEAPLQLLQGDNAQTGRYAKKFDGPVNPVAEEGKEKKMVPTPNVMAAAKANVYDTLIARASSPAEIAAIEVARRQDLDKNVSEQVTDQVITNFRLWLLKSGRKEDHVRAGWWPVKDGRPVAATPKFLQAGGCLSNHPSVHAYIDQFVDAAHEFEKSMLMMDVEARGGAMQNWPIEKLWAFYKFRVLGMAPDTELDLMFPASARPAPGTSLPSLLAAGATPSTVPPSPDRRAVEAEQRRRDTEKKEREDRKAARHAEKMKAHKEQLSALQKLQSGGDSEKADAGKKAKEREEHDKQLAAHEQKLKAAQDAHKRDLQDWRGKADAEATKAKDALRARDEALEAHRKAAENHREREKAFARDALAAAQAADTEHKKHIGQMSDELKAKQKEHQQAIAQQTAAHLAEKQRLQSEKERLQEESKKQIEQVQKELADTKDKLAKGDFSKRLAENAVGAGEVARQQTAEQLKQLQLDAKKKDKENDRLKEELGKTQQLHAQARLEKEAAQKAAEEAQKKHDEIKAAAKTEISRLKKVVNDHDAAAKQRLLEKTAEHDEHLRRRVEAEKNLEKANRRLEAARARETEHETEIERLKHGLTIVEHQAKGAANKSKDTISGLRVNSAAKDKKIAEYQAWITEADERLQRLARDADTAKAEKNIWLQQHSQAVHQMRAQLEELNATNRRTTEEAAHREQTLRTVVEAWQNHAAVLEREKGQWQTRASETQNVAEANLRQAIEAQQKLDTERRTKENVRAELKAERQEKTSLAQQLELALYQKTEAERSAYEQHYYGKGVEEALALTQEQLRAQSADAANLHAAIVQYEAEVAAYQQRNDMANRDLTSKLHAMAQVSTLAAKHMLPDQLQSLVDPEADFSEHSNWDNNFGMEDIPATDVHRAVLNSRITQTMAKMVTLDPTALNQNAFRSFMSNLLDDQARMKFFPDGASETDQLELQRINASLIGMLATDVTPQLKAEYLQNLVGLNGVSGSAPVRISPSHVYAYIEAFEHFSVAFRNTVYSNLQGHDGPLKQNFLEEGLVLSGLVRMPDANAQWASAATFDSLAHLQMTYASWLPGQGGTPPLNYLPAPPVDRWPEGFVYPFPVDGAPGPAARPPPEAFPGVAPEMAPMRPPPQPFPAEIVPEVVDDVQ